MEKHTIITLKLRGKSNRRISQETGIDRKTIAKYWNEYQRKMSGLLDGEITKEQQEKIIEAPKYDASNRRASKYTEEIDHLLDEILQQEKEKLRILGETHKQKLTNIQIHEMVKEQGYDIGITTISDHVRKKRAVRKEVFIRQEYELGDRLEYDFGEVKLNIAGESKTYYLAVFSSPASGGRWAYLYKNQKKEVFLDSHVKFFEQMGGAYREVVYDNMKNVVTKFIGRNEKRLNEDLLKLSMYYGYQINVTNCFRGNEKGHVEGSVKIIRNRIFARKYQFTTLLEAEEYLADMLLTMNQGTDLEEEKNALLPWRPKLELATLTKQKVDKYSFICVDQNFYSVPEYLVGHTVTIKKYLSEIIVYAGNELVCQHKKIDGFHEMQVDIFHYLDTFQKKPGALKHSKALKSRSQLKTIYDHYFTKRTRDFIALLQEHQDEPYEKLLELCIAAAHDKTISRTTSDKKAAYHIEDQTKTQIQKLSDIYNIGGEELVH